MSIAMPTNEPQPIVLHVRQSAHGYGPVIEAISREQLRLTSVLNDSEHLSHGTRVTYHGARQLLLELQNHLCAGERRMSLQGNAAGYRHAATSEERTEVVRAAQDQVAVIAPVLRLCEQHQITIDHVLLGGIANPAHPVAPRPPEPLSETTRLLRARHRGESLD